MQTVSVGGGRNPCSQAGRSQPLEPQAFPTLSRWSAVGLRSWKGLQRCLLQMENLRSREGIAQGLTVRWWLSWDQDTNAGVLSSQPWSAKHPSTILLCL